MLQKFYAFGIDLAHKACGSRHSRQLVAKGSNSMLELYTSRTFLVLTLCFVVNKVILSFFHADLNLTSLASISSGRFSQAPLGW